MMSTLYNPFAPKDKLDQEAKKMISEATAGQRALFASDAVLEEEGVSMSDQIDALLAGYEEVNKSLDAVNVVEAVEALFPVAEEYEAQSAQYKELGWLTTEGGKEGIRDKEGIFYPMPTLAEVYEVLSEQLELLQYKAKQGFTRFILAPIGLSYVDMYEKLGTEYQRYQRDPALGLYRTDAEKTPYTGVIGSTCFTGTTLKDEGHYYYPKTLREGVDPTKHGGKTKEELITTSKFPGWEIHILPEDTNLPRAGMQGKKEQGGRVPLPACLRFEDYLDIIQGRQERADGFSTKDETGAFVFKGESGLIPEVWVSLAFQRLREGQLLLSDYCHSDDHGTVLIGMLTRLNSVPVAFFQADTLCGQVFLYDNYLDIETLWTKGALSSVKVC